MTGNRELSGTEVFQALISESQFASHESVAGIRTLASVKHPSQFGGLSAAKQFRYNLHNGLFSLSTGIERLAKLSISLAAYRQEGRFPNVRNYRHKIDELLDEVEAIELPATASGPHLTRPTFSRSDEYIEILTKYAQAHHRYEYLDALSAGQAGPDLYTKWLDLVATQVVRQEIASLSFLPKMIQDALLHLSNLLGQNSGIDGLETLAAPYIFEFLDCDLYPPSVEVALGYYKLVRWVGRVLSCQGHELFYSPPPHLAGQPPIPLLGEVTDPYFYHSSTKFMGFHILRLDDVDATIETLQEVLGHRWEEE